ncbi:UNVERIFIED_CONTAM: hypothetical protein PYX00_008547 [Menopon gallinae]|uniref:Uncharacterized protein n=1 Tax=Menopon gallinae TaxID=328185 RepID=A0AAW2HNA0_9NEOP
MSKMLCCLLVTKKMTDECEATVTLLNKLHDDCFDSEFHDEIETLKLQILHRQICFDACGFFKIDLNLLQFVSTSFISN